MLGAGNRGFDVYGRYALEHPNELKFVAVADRNPEKLERFGIAHGIPVEHQFLSWQDALSTADVVFVCLPDALHQEVAVAALSANKHLLLEKPAATTLEGTKRVLAAAQASSGVLMLGYVLRYTAFFQKVQEILHSGTIGDLINLDWRENVSSTHYSHSYVRGNWRREDTSSPMILAKCSHDLDLISWLTNTQVATVSSFAGLKHFRLENAPQNAPERCLDGCPHESCEFDAAKIYLQEPVSFPATIISADPSLAARKKALETSDYGRCVYRMDNNVVDHQVASFLLKNGASGTFAMHGHSSQEGRSLRFDGTKATLRGVFKASLQELRLEPHNYQTSFGGGGQTISFDHKAGHGGGDAGLTKAFLEAVQLGVRQDPSQYFESHLLAFALEQARHSHQVVDLIQFKGEVGF